MIIGWIAALTLGMVGEAGAQDYDWRTEVVTFAEKQLGTVETARCVGTEVYGATRLREIYSSEAPTYGGSIPGYGACGASRPQWCGIFALWVYDQAGVPDVPKWVDGQGIAHHTGPGGAFVRTYRPERADICVKDCPAPPEKGSCHHVILASTPASDGSVRVVNGNGGSGGITLSTELIGSFMSGTGGGCYTLRE